MNQNRTEHALSRFNLTAHFTEAPKMLRNNPDICSEISISFHKGAMLQKYSIFGLKGIFSGHMISMCWAGLKHFPHPLQRYIYPELQKKRDALLVGFYYWLGPVGTKSQVSPKILFDRSRKTWNKSGIRKTNQSADKSNVILRKLTRWLQLWTKTRIGRSAIPSSG